MSTNAKTSPPSGRVRVAMARTGRWSILFFEARYNPQKTRAAKKTVSRPEMHQYAKAELAASKNGTAIERIVDRYRGCQ